jgi:serine/threonine protein phosphatase PrpC
MATAPAPTCPACGAVAEPADRFCEACGTAFGDHRSVDLGSLAGVSDKGHRHDRNEDAMAVAVTRTPTGLASIAVVCDGVSTSDRPDEASRTAADVAAEVAATGLRAGVASDDALRQAALAADEAVRELAGNSDNAPATTLVAAVATAAHVSVCWIGDSRAYWLPADDPMSARLLTRDDSLAGELAAVGVLTEAEALVSEHAHVVTRWLGADAEEPEPHVVTVEPATPGILLLCSDGLWNYLPDATGLHHLALPTALSDLAGAAEALLAFALDSGGHDNTTVVLAAVPPVASDASSPGDST